MANTDILAYMIESYVKIQNLISNFEKIGINMDPNKEKPNSPGSLLYSSLHALEDGIMTELYSDYDPDKYGDKLIEIINNIDESISLDNSDFSDIKFNDYLEIALKISDNS